jgi:hypothetical protein
MVTLDRVIRWARQFVRPLTNINAINVEYSMTHQTTSIGQVSRGYCLLNSLYHCATLLARKYGRMNGGCVQELSVADVHRKYQWRMCTGSISGGCVEEKLTKNIEKCNVRKPQNVITLLLMSNSYIPLSRNICSRTV